MQPHDANPGRPATRAGAEAGQVLKDPVFQKKNHTTCLAFPHIFPPLLAIVQVVHQEGPQGPPAQLGLQQVAEAPAQVQEGAAPAGPEHRNKS